VRVGPAPTLTDAAPLQSSTHGKDPQQDRSRTVPRLIMTLPTRLSPTPTSHFAPPIVCLLSPLRDRQTAQRRKRRTHVAARNESA
jgi:hypothetical protein